MKKIFSILTITAMVSVATAQDLKNSVAAKNPQAVPAVIDPTTDHEPDEYAYKVNTKAVRDLAKNFKSDGDEKWYEMPYGFRAKFKSKEISYRVDYDKKGNRLSVVRSYQETQLSTTIRSLVKSVYYDYAIVLVEEIIKPMTEMTYVVHLEGKTEWINVIVQNSDMVEWQRFNKSK